MPTPSGLELTLRLLTKSPNPAAIEVLDAGLRSAEPTVRAASVRALALRRGRDAGRALLLAFPETPPDVQQAATTRQIVKRLRPVAAAAITGDDYELCQRACSFAEASCDHHLLPALVDAARQADHPHGRRLASAALRLARDLSDAIDNPPRGEEGAPREDPAFARRAALTALSRAADYYNEHRQHPLVEAFLLLVVPEDLVLRRMLDDTSHKAHQGVCKVLANGTAKNVMRLLTHALVQEHPPEKLLQKLTERSDQEFVEYLLDELGEPIPLRARNAASRLKGFAWADKACEPLLLKLDGKRQAVAIRLLAETTLSKRRLTDLAELLLDKGGVAARVAVCSVLGKIKAKAASELVRKAMHDQHPSVVAAAVAQLRMRGMDGSTKALIRLLDHESSEVKQAAQHELTELNYTALRDAYDSLDDAQRRRHGQLVAKADPACGQHARADLRAASHNQKLRTLELIDVLGVGDELADELIRLLEDEDPALRAAAARALAASTKDESIAALTRILEDVSATVREIARAGLAGQSKQASSSAVDGKAKQQEPDHE